MKSLEEIKLKTFISFGHGSAAEGEKMYLHKRQLKKKYGRTPNNKFSKMDRKYLEKQFSIGPKIAIIFSFKIRAQRRGKVKENKSTKGVGNWHAQLKKEEK